MMDGLMRIRGAIWCLPLLCLSAALGWGQQDTFAIAGVVRDAQGHGVAEASVRLRQQGVARTEERKSDSRGGFLFPALKPGVYMVSAARGDQHSSAVEVKVANGASQRVELTLSDGVAPAANSARSEGGKGPDLELSDAPQFTVAAVTDWTAAGGHGSDVSLRASEALTRDTLRLKPEAKTKPLATQDASETERRLRQALDESPRDVAANEALGRFYLNAERYTEAIAPFETAHELEPSRADDEYALAVALARSGRPGQAREHVMHLLATGDNPEWHRLAGEVDEKLGDPLAAVHAFEQAVKEDPSEENYFAWGTELLQHRAIWQAKDVFEAAVKAHPASPRLLTALGTALFSAALYAEAAQRLCQASDLAPNDPEPYLFMGEVDVASPDPLPCIENKLERFVREQPANALGNYYYARAYWKQHGKSTDAGTVARVQSLLTRAVETDPKCSPAYLQLGVIQASQSHYQKAAEFYEKAIQADSNFTEAHYRLGVAYDRLGEKGKAAEQFSIHARLKAQEAAAVDRQRREVKQFLVLAGGEQEHAGKP